MVRQSKRYTNKQTNKSKKVEWRENPVAWEASAPLTDVCACV